MSDLNPCGARHHPNVVNYTYALYLNHIEPDGLGGFTDTIYFVGGLSSTGAVSGSAPTAPAEYDIFDDMIVYFDHNGDLVRVDIDEAAL